MRSPKWLRDEIILCLDLYLNHNGNKIQKNDPKVAELSDILNKLPIVSNKVEFEKFRNENGVYMKLMNFKAFDTSYNGKGLEGGSKLDEEVFNEFFNQRELLAELAKGIKSLTNNETISSEIREMDEDEESNDRKEGKVLYKYHRYRERNSKVIENKKKQFIKENGSLYCENCGFNYSKVYGNIGDGFIEAHHIVPLHKLDGETKTTEKDLILLCANCHRMIHKVDDLDLSKIKISYHF
jgi:5-methylcytosine-specific restriction protein A